MKTIAFFLFSAVVALALVSCDDDETNNNNANNNNTNYDYACLQIEEWFEEAPHCVQATAEYQCTNLIPGMDEDATGTLLECAPLMQELQGVYTTHDASWTAELESCVGFMETQGLFSCEEGAACGDGICQEEESYATCPADCTPVCGDGIMEGDEECDGTDFGVASVGCVNFPGYFGDGQVTCSDGCKVDLSQCSFTKKVDILFMVDNSLSMEVYQDRLSAALSSLFTGLNDFQGSKADVHVGVITPDLGTEPYSIPSCETPGGDNGVMVVGDCGLDTTGNYMVDVDPAGCIVTTDGSSVTHDCTQANCDAAAFDGEEMSGLSLVQDEEGYPRCRSAATATLEEQLNCNFDVGVNGCGFEQPLEAMRLALANQHTENDQFLRPDALLAIVFLTDEDDCSVANPELFNPDGDITSTLGPLTSFRCTEFGIVCDESYNRIVTSGDVDEYHNCVPRDEDDPQALLHPISRYVDFLHNLHPESLTYVATIAGPSDGSLFVTADVNGFPKLVSSCENAVPAVRLSAFADAFQKEPSHSSWTHGDICAPNFTSVLEQLGQTLKSRILNND